MTEPQKLEAGDRIRVTFEAVVEIPHGYPLIRPAGLGGSGFHLDRVPGIAYEIIAPEIKPLDIIDARWLDSLPLGSIVLCEDNDTEWPWIKAKLVVGSDRTWMRAGVADTFACIYPSSHYCVLRVGWGFEE